MTLATETDTREVIGANTKRLREELGLSVIAAAERLGVGRQYWYLIESGSTNITLDKLEGIARILGVTVRDLLEDPDKTKRRRRMTLQSSAGFIGVAGTKERRR